MLVSALSNSLPLTLGICGLEISDTASDRIGSLNPFQQEAKEQNYHILATLVPTDLGNDTLRWKV
jgi:hypothetical protein